MCFRSVNLLMAHERLVIIGKQAGHDARQAAGLQFNPCAIVAKWAVGTGASGDGHASLSSGQAINSPPAISMAW
jgi:hypothetical protein